MPDRLQLVQTQRQIVIFFSSPADLQVEKTKLVSIVEQLRPVFSRRGISLKPWTFESDAVPAIARDGSSVQTIIDAQLPRQADGSLAYQIYVGLMRRRIGTPLNDAPSGTVHEFLEAKRSFESRGTPRILFYFGGAEPTPSDTQWAAVEQFRAQYPGLFSNFASAEDLAKQFRRHLLSELLDLVDLGAEPSPALDPDWVRRLSERYEGIRRSLPSVINSEADKSARIVRQLHLLLGIGTRLSYQESRILIASLYAVLADAITLEQTRVLLSDSPELVAGVFEVANRSRDASKLLRPSAGEARLDLLGALVRLGPRLDLRRGALKHGEVPQEDAPTEDWLAYLTTDIVCERGLVGFHLVAPESGWIEPLADATAVAMESLWQQIRGVLTRYGMVFAVGRCQFELDGGLTFMPAVVRTGVIASAKQAVESLPKVPHFGEAELPELARLLPLPQSKTRTPVVFRTPPGIPARLRVNGTVVMERGELETWEIQYPPADQLEEVILECDEGGEYLPVVQSRLQRLSPLEESILDSGPVTIEVLSRLGLWNEALERTWPPTRGSVTREDLLGLFHILREAFLQICPDTNSLHLRRDLYWDAMEIVRNHLA